MKKFNLIIILIILLGISATSCKKFVEGYEKNPNAFDYTTPNLVVPGMMLQNQFFHKADGMRMAMMWMNQATGVDRQYKTLDNWNNASGEEFNNPWTEVYTTLGQADWLTKFSLAKKDTVLAGLGKLYQAWAGGEAASLWGDVPFSQRSNDNYPNPVFDKQQDVFNAVQSLLDEAIEYLNSGVGSIPDDKDIYFEGDVDKWIKVAHGLKARFYLHAKKYQKALEEADLGPSSEIYDLYALFDSNDATPWGKKNPTWQFMIARKGYLNAENAGAKDLLDSRQNSKTKEGGRKQYNYTGDDLNYNSGDGVTGKFFGNMKLLTYGEMLLIKTECILRTGGSIDDALVPYNIYRDLLQNKYDTGGYGGPINVKYKPYLAEYFDVGGIENKPPLEEVSPKKAFYREIFEERYIYFIGDYESFIDYARSHNDPDVPSYMKLSYDENDEPKYSGEPLRFIYPQNEADSNINFPGSVSIDTPLPIYN